MKIKLNKKNKIQTKTIKKTKNMKKKINIPTLTCASSTEPR